ncbi:MAG: biotin/lipoyl-binding protein [Deltaproteobacteria bacterium]|nr:biotin/lipoyl-binding protein [Deltaproteobacteria bacterium]
MIFEAQIAEKSYKIDVQKKMASYVIKIDSSVYDIPLNWENLFELHHKTQQVIASTVSKTKLRCFINGRALDVFIQTEQEKIQSSLSQAEEGRELITSMPGKIVKILVTQGQKVSKNESVLIMEAMKMENILKSPCSGVVQSIYVKENDSVEAQTKVLEIECEQEKI